MSYPFDQRFLDLPEYATVGEVCVPDVQRQKLENLLMFIWPDHDPTALQAQFFEIIAEAHKRVPAEKTTESTGWSEQQLVLICYGDHLWSRDPNLTPLQALGAFCRQHFSEPEFAHLTLHLLPIYQSPYKDGGFDVADPFAVNPKMGTWADVRAIRQHFQVALDFVANHLSTASAWFTRYMQDDPLYQDFFIGFDDEATVRRLEREVLPQIYRPRPHNPFIPVTKPDGATRWVYMTFSDHQADVNYQNPFVFLKMMEVLLFYILQGVSLIRLDAIPYLWKEWGTSCAHHPKTHALLSLFRLAVDMVNPAVKLLAESMEPLADSLRYLSTTEQAKAHIAYNFVPCGLIPYTLLTEDASVFQRNLQQFRPPGAEVDWAVVCGVTHDGSSLNPCRAPQSIVGEAVLQEEQINTIARYYTASGDQEIATRSALAPEHPHHIRADFRQHFSAIHREQPRFVNYKAITDEDGQRQQIVYEAISTYASLFRQNPDQIIAALAMALGLPGIPFTYFTLPFAVLNDYTAYLETGNPRELNRGRVLLEDLLQDLTDQGTLAHQVFCRYKQLLRLRASHPAFHPHGSLIPITTTNAAILSFLRISVDRTQQIMIVQNVSSRIQNVTIHLHNHVLNTTVACVDIISEKSFPVKAQTLALRLEPFALLWLTDRSDHRNLKDSLDKKAEPAGNTEH
jgi:glycosidase